MESAVFFLVEGRSEVMGHRSEWPKSETDSRKTYTIDVGLEPRNEAISVFTWVRASFSFHHFHFARLSALWWFCHGLPCPARENLPSSSDSLQVGIELGFADRLSLYLHSILSLPRLRLFFKSIEKRSHLVAFVAANRPVPPWHDPILGGMFLACVGSPSCSAMSLL